MRRRQRLLERRQQLSNRSAYFPDQRAALVEINRVRPGPDAPYLDAGTQMGVAAAEAAEECIELLVILRAGVLTLPKPGPQVFPDLVVAVRPDLSEIISRPAMDVLGDVEVTVREKPLGNRGVVEAICRLGVACHAPGCSATKSMSRWALPVRYRALACGFSSAGKVESARLSSWCSREIRCVDFVLIAASSLIVAPVQGSLSASTSSMPVTSRSNATRRSWLSCRFTRPPIGVSP
jgi:hypothetical protein